MTITHKTEAPVRASSAARRTGWTLLLGGILFFVGGGMHPKEDPPDVTVREHLVVMFEDPAWFPAHAVLLAGMVLIAAALVVLVRRADAPVRQALLVAAVAATLATVDMLLHLVAAFEADSVEAGRATPVVDVHLVMEAVTVPAFGLAIAALAVVGARTRTLGSWWVAPLGVAGGVGYALAAATFLFTDRLDVLFPLASGIGLWAVASGVGLIRARRGLGRPGLRA